MICPACGLNPKLNIYQDKRESSALYERIKVCPHCNNYIGETSHYFIANPKDIKVVQE